MRLAIIGSNPYYETDRILYEAIKAGHEAVFLPKRNIMQTTFFNKGEFGVFFKPPKKETQTYNIELFKELTPINLTPDSKYSPTIEKKSLLSTKSVKVEDYYDLRYFDVVIIREMAKTLEWTSVLADYLMSYNKTVVEQKIGKQMFYRSKHGTFYQCSKLGVPYPKTFAVTSKNALIDHLEYIKYPLIVKKSISSKGKGVYKCSSREEVLDLISIEGIKLAETLFQEVVDYNGDIRVFVVGDKILGAMRREPQKGEWKGNVAQGASAYPIDISDELKDMALNIVQKQQSEICGVDIMLPKTGPVLIETNRAPQFKGFESSIGVNVAKEIVEYVENRFKNEQKQ